MDIVFSHGNSFVAGVYSTLFAALSERGFTVRGTHLFPMERPQAAAEAIEAAAKSVSSFSSAKKAPSTR